MITIVNESEELIPYKEGKMFEVIPNEEGFGLYLDNDLIETYGSEELAVKVMKEVSIKIETKVEYISMKQIHQELEV